MGKFGHYFHGCSYGRWFRLTVQYTWKWGLPQFAARVMTTLSHWVVENMRVKLLTNNTAVVVWCVRVRAQIESDTNTSSYRPHKSLQPKQMLQPLWVLLFQLTSNENKRVGDFWNFVACIFPFNLMGRVGEICRSSTFRAFLQCCAVLFALRISTHCRQQQP